MTSSIKFKNEEAALFYEILRESKSQILRFLKDKKVVGTNPHGEATRFFDKAIESTIISKLRKKGFEGTIIGEELGEFRCKDRGLVYIDPLDGSLNLVRGIDFYCLSLAYAAGPNIKELKVGFIWDIPRDTIYFAERDHGAFKLKDKKIVRLVVPQEVDEIIIDVGFTTNEHCLREIRSRGTLRRMGSIALSAAFVADGRFDGVFDMGDLKVTDAIAAYLIVKEAGGYAFLSTSDISRNSRVKFIAARNKALFDWLLELYNRHIKVLTNE